MTEKEILAFCHDNNVEISICFERIMNSFSIRMRRGNYAIDNNVPMDIALGPGFSLSIRVLLRQMVAVLNDMEGMQ